MTTALHSCLANCCSLQMETPSLWQADNVTVSPLPRAVCNIACHYHVSSTCSLRLELHHLFTSKLHDSQLPAFTLKHLKHSIVEHLLLMDPCQSSAPKKVRQGRNSGTYRGVRMRTWGKWVSEIRVPKTGQRIWLGSYDAPEKAARAYDAAQYCIRGECGQFNFPAERRPQLPSGPVDALSKKEIKAIAFNFASSASVSPSVITPVEMVGPSLPNLQVSSATGNPGNVEGYVPASALVPDLCSIDNLQLDDLLMLDIE